MRIFAEDEGGDYVTLTYFNNPGWGKKQLPLGETKIVSGRLDRYGQELQMVHPDYVLPPAEAATIPVREPVYPLSEGLTNHRLADLAAQALGRRPDLGEWIEPSLKAKQGWPDWAEALAVAHRDPAAAKARERLAYDEVFANQLALMLVRASSRRRRGVPLRGDGSLRDRLSPSLHARPARSSGRCARSRATCSRRCRCSACCRAMSARARPSSL